MEPSIGLETTLALFPYPVVSRPKEWLLVVVLLAASQFRFKLNFVALKNPQHDFTPPRRSIKRNIKNSNRSVTFLFGLAEAKIFVTLQDALIIEESADCFLELHFQPKMFKNATNLRSNYLGGIFVASAAAAVSALFVALGWRTTLIGECVCAKAKAKRAAPKN